MKVFLKRFHKNVDRDSMRQIWVISDDKSVSEQLAKALTYEVFGMRYGVAQSDSVAMIPDRDIKDPGVVFLVDAFHSPVAGFTGVRELRRRGFKGHIFVCGEPAPEEAVDPFSKEEFSGFFPPTHRLDYHFTAGLIHYALHFSGDLRLSQFLSKGGRASTENIQSIQDFNQLTLKLINFVNRFGVDIQKIKKALVSLSYSHVQPGAGGISIPKPFRLSFGLDPKKIIIATNIELDSEKDQQLREEFCKSLTDHRTEVTPASQKSGRPDFRNTARLTENLTVIWGDANSADWKKSGKAYVLIAIPFNFQTAKGERPYFFNYIRIQPSKEKEDAFVAKADEVAVGSVTHIAGAAPATSDFQAIHQVHETPSTEPQEVHEPTIMGDTPSNFEPDIAESALREMVADTQATPATGDGNLDVPPNSDNPDGPGENAIASQEYEALKDKFDNAQKELSEQKVLAKSLAEDVKRLMRERRQPISAGELKELNEELKGKIERIQAQNKALIDELAVKDARMKDLEEQVKRLKVAA
jgi:hypothetical protein